MGEDLCKPGQKYLNAPTCSSMLFLYKITKLLTCHTPFCH